MKLLKRIGRFFGPGFITGASDDDPSGIATYSQTGAMFGFKQLWTSVFSFPMMATIQEMCGRIGCVTNKGLTQVIKEHYAPWILYSTVALLFIANAINIGADLGVMAEAAQLIIPLPYWVLFVGIVVGTLSLEIFVTYATYARYLVFFACSLLGYVLTIFFVEIDWKQVFISTFVPEIEFTQAYLMNFIAIFGTTISPYMFFWQSNQEVEEKKTHTTEIPLCDHLSNARQESIIGMFFSNLIMWFIIIVTGATLFKNGIHTISSASEAALALKPFAGEYAFLMFTLGIIGTGLLAVPILGASSAYAVCEAFGWPASLSLHHSQGRKFYGIIILAVLFGSLVNVLPINSISLLYYTAIINGILAPPLLFIILKVANNATIMGPYTNGKLSNTLGVSACLVMSLAALALLATIAL